MTSPGPADANLSVLIKSYRALIGLASNEQSVLDRSIAIAERSMLGNIKIMRRGTPDVTFALTRSAKGTYRLYQNDARLALSRSEFKFYKFFDAVLRVSVGEHARDLLFIHAGAVGWKGKVILLPADSFHGKSTLVAELVRAGADYYSDDFAIIDANGAVHPFARPLSMRTNDKKMKLYDIDPHEIGSIGKPGTPVGAVVFTQFKAGSRWRPRRLTAGEGVLSMIPFALPIRRTPEFSMRVLNIIAGRAILLSSPRGEANIFAENLLNYVDKHVY